MAADHHGAIASKTFYPSFSPVYHIRIYFYFQLRYLLLVFYRS